jgi:hypothetical protein
MAAAWCRWLKSPGPPAQCASVAAAAFSRRATGRCSVCRPKGRSPAGAAAARLRPALAPSAPTPGRLIRLESSHFQEVSKRIEIVALGKARQFDGKRSNIEGSFRGARSRHLAFENREVPGVRVRVQKRRSHSAILPFEIYHYKNQPKDVACGSRANFSVGPNLRPFGLVLGRNAYCVRSGNDLTGGVALPMFPPANGAPRASRNAKMLISQ